MSRALASGIIKGLRDKGYQAYMAGGCVRDEILGRTPNDYDVATSATPDEVQTAFKHTVPTGVKYGTVTVLHNKASVEVTTFRKDGPYLDGRHPQSVDFCDDKEDALRRDFTINALFYDPLTKQIIDYVEGQNDLQQKLIRAVGDPKLRFEEDKLRMLRAVRFAAQLDFTIDGQTFKAIQAMAEHITQVSPERIRDEVLKLLCAPHARKGMELLDASGLLQVIMPEVSAMKGVEQPPEFHPEGDVWVHTLILLEQFKQPSPELAMAGLLHDVGKPPTYEVADRIRFNNHPNVGADMSRVICKRLKCSNDFTEQVFRLVRDHLKFKDVFDMRLSTLKRFLGQEDFDLHMELHRADCLACHGILEAYNFCQQKREEFAQDFVLKPEPLVKGRDLIDWGYKPGRQFKDMLEYLYNLQLEGKLTDKAEALERLDHFIR